MSSRPSSPVSLEQKLSRLLAVLLLAVLLVLLAIAAWTGRESAIQFALSRLHHDAEAIISKLDTGTKRITGSLSPIYHQPLSGHYYLLRFEDGTELRSRSLWDMPFQVPARPAPRSRYWLEPGPRGQRLLVWQRSFEKGGVAFSIAIAEDVAPLLSAIWRFVWIGVLASLAAVLLMLLAQRWLIRRTFAQLDHIREEVREIRQGKREFVGTEVPAEVLPVVEEFNQLLQAWKQHLVRSRKAVGNLAHALKTPLQLILAHGKQQKKPVIEEQALHMQGLIEQELKRARLTGRAAAGRYFSPREDLQALLDTVATLYHHKALQMETRIAAPERLPLDQSDLMELLGNLLDNAAKWADQRLSLELQADDRRLWLVIEDDGPGIEVDQRRQLLERGSRLDENQPGHGLGLAIARDIITLYQGRIHLDESAELGGLRAEIELPLSTEQ